MSSIVALIAFPPGAGELLSRWLAEPHVAPWYPNPEEHLAWANEPPVGGQRALITCDGLPVGYIRWQLVPREVLDSVGLDDVPENSADVDLLIGDPKYIGKGAGPRALKLLVEELRQRSEVPLVGLTTSVHNRFAHAAFGKAGFHIDRQY